MRVDKKGAIDLVTEVDLQIEREFRAMIAERFPDHVVLGEEFETRGDREATPPFCWVFDPVDGTTNYAHGLPIFCSSLGARNRRRDRGRRDLRPDAPGAVHGRARPGRVAERTPAARLGGRHADRFAARDRLPLRHPAGPGGARQPVPRVHHEVARRAPAGVGGAGPVLRRRRALRRLLGVEDPAVGRRRRRADRRRGGRPGLDRGRRARSAPAPAACWRATATSTISCSRSSAASTRRVRAPNRTQ